MNGQKHKSCFEKKNIGIFLQGFRKCVYPDSTCLINTVKEKSFISLCLPLHPAMPTQSKESINFYWFMNEK